MSDIEDLFGRRCDDYDPDCATCFVYKQQDEIEKLRRAMHDIYEVYAGSESFIPQYCAEAYLQGLVKEMADIAAKHKRRAD